MSLDRLPFRPSPHSPLGLKETNKSLQKNAEILDATSAFHATFSFSNENNSINFELINPALEKELNSVKDNPEATKYLIDKLRSNIVTHNWQQTEVLSFSTTLSPDIENSKVYGLTIEKINEKKYHLTGRNITDKEKIRQQKEYELTHDPLTGYLNSIGAQKLFEKINNEKRDSLKPKNVTIFFFDLAGLKKINDTINHESGDKHIFDTYKLIKENCFRDDDNFIRIYNQGDELIVPVFNLSQNGVDTITKNLEDFRQNDPVHKFYFGKYTDFPDQSGRLDFPSIIEKADNNQNNDKIRQKSIK